MYYQKEILIKKRKKKMNNILNIIVDFMNSFTGTIILTFVWIVALIIFVATCCIPRKKKFSDEFNEELTNGIVERLRLENFMDEETINKFERGFRRAFKKNKKWNKALNKHHKELKKKYDKLGKEYTKSIGSAEYYNSEKVDPNFTFRFRYTKRNLRNEILWTMICDEKHRNPENDKYIKIVLDKVKYRADNSLVLSLLNYFTR